MPLILTGDDYPAIRAALDPALTADLIPDAVIALDLYQGLAEARVRDQVPTADALVAAGGDPARQVRAAAALYCAALLAPVVPRLVSEQIGRDYRYQRQEVPLDVLVRELEGRATDALARAQGLNPTAAPAVATHFTAAPGTRGKRFGAPNAGDLVGVPGWWP